MQVIYPGSRGQSGEGRRSLSRLLRGQLGLNLPEPPREFWGHAPQSRLTWVTGWAAPTVGDYLAHPDGPARGQSEGRHPASTLISDFRPPGLQDNKFPLFSAARGEVLCHSSLRKLIHPVYQRPLFGESSRSILPLLSSICSFIYQILPKERLTCCLSLEIKLSESRKAETHVSCHREMGPPETKTDNNKTML